MTSGQHPNPRTRPSHFVVLLIATFALFASALLASMVGSVDIPLSDSIAIVLANVGIQTGNPIQSHAHILVDIRIPRVVAAATTGMCLACAGVLYQGVLRNPLADPFVIGASGGAALGALLGMLIAANRILPAEFAITPTLSLIGALLSVWLAYSLSRSRGFTRISSLLLAGFAIGSFTGSLSALLIFINNSMRLRLVQTYTWLLGGVSTNDWITTIATFSLAIITIICSLLIAIHLNALSLGNNSARRLGVDVEKVRLVAILLASMLTGLAVWLSGIVALVGLVIPHSMRMLVGPDHRILIPTSALVGSTFVVITDMVARSAFSPAEIPVGIITSLIGIPVFVLLIRKNLHQYDF